MPYLGIFDQKYLLWTGILKSYIVIFEISVLELFLLQSLVQK